MNKRRFFIQLIFLVVIITGGVRFMIYIQELKQGIMTGTRPGVVEGFLPISALMSFKKFIMTGAYDFIHPAGLTLFIFIILVSIIFKKSFCSHICPVGFISESISLLSKKIRINKYLFHILTVVKYGILGFFGYMILWQMSVRSIDSFLKAPFNIVADAKMMYFFMPPSRTTIIVLAVVLLLTLISKNVWCRLLCPYGALLGLISILSPFKVKRDASACVDCRKCTAVCPNDIQVHQKGRIDSPECFGCFDCVSNRHNDECLRVTGGLKHSYLPYIIAGLLAVTVISAMSAGYWKSSVSNEQYRRYLNVINQVGH
ncbi:4Fe-4S ferredoxin iron-sulfur binding domain protein [Denitrovibrio acetiphilus DSM 12809]|uniref:4Fe-4S ferredoxin iron-sulfur binding domain protein n=1 Tax=Denitrovibrio acetiphilus (strain DSM 12809 / NBRC 114555 / N2460) TaxID=522772 RepID=D4H602_DENA2|nr:4Fe-4S binding protein [Denitrovibrio acetiphilus]ADD67648.1 4Fe-4S ferredoxin iron-sulfur binding domain protein [Denitrovibrio acetiphilus DSM 12809]